MSITTVEELDNLPVGATVRCQSRLNGDQVWERVEGGFRRPDTVLVVKPDLFVGYLTANAVRLEDTPTVTNTVTIPEDLVAQLRSYAVEVEDSAFDEILDAFHIGRDRQHISMVHISGTYDYYPDPIQVRDALLDGHDLDRGLTVETISTASVTWTKSVAVTRSGRGCTCGEVDRDVVGVHVPGNANGDWSYECACG